MKTKCLLCNQRSNVPFPSLNEGQGMWTHVSTPSKVVTHVFTRLLNSETLMCHNYRWEAKLIIRKCFCSEKVTKNKLPPKIKRSPAIFTCSSVSEDLAIAFSIKEAHVNLLVDLARIEGHVWSISNLGKAAEWPSRAKKGKKPLLLVRFLVWWLRTHC